MTKYKVNFVMLINCQLKSNEQHKHVLIRMWNWMKKVTFMQEENENKNSKYILQFFISHNINEELIKYTVNSDYHTEMHH